ncbi:MAG TPA: NfeD family protein [Ignavibacteria bacterium]|nr:NfeD family protein [Ignavibacteria bacterium]
MNEIEILSLVWFIVGIILLLSELIIPGFVIFFFGIGALVTSLIIFFVGIESVPIQILIFLLSSILSLVLLRKYFSKLFKGKVDNKEELKDEFLGKKCLVINEIKPNSLKGKVELNGAIWEADSEFFIERGVTVEIIGRNNITLIVKPVEI